MTFDDEAGGQPKASDDSDESKTSDDDDGQRFVDSGKEDDADDQSIAPG